MTDLKRKLKRYIRRYNDANNPVKWVYRTRAQRVATDTGVTVHSNRLVSLLGR